MRKLADKRRDLFDKVLSGTLAPNVALKQMGKNVSAARATTAKAVLVRVQDVINPEIENNVHEGDAAEVLKRVGDGLASLVVFSPPYHGFKEIVYEPPLPERAYDEYLQHLRGVLIQSHRVSRIGGRLSIVLDTPRNRDAGRHFMIPVVADVTRLAIDVGWDFWNDIAWCKDEVSGKKTAFGSLALCSAPMLSRNHETILLFYKQTHKLDGDQALCDLTRAEHLAWWTSAWHVKPEVDKKIRDVHPAPFPETLVERLVKLFTYRRDLVIDPYNGSGTTTAVARRLGRRFIGIDQSRLYCTQARERLARVGSAKGCASPRRVETRVVEAQDADPSKLRSPLPIANTPLAPTPTDDMFANSDAA
ncbi:MAG TPA: site-specific DNA-methyltransferase [Tepidisphaeraceae bacterium]|nr:site-specific DNA-methyltransferase [Tepidisphaeraceae bacterium]